MDESRYQHLADAALHAIETMLEDVDAEVVDLERAGDVLTLTFPERKKAVINTQRPTRQIWVAANARAWHFNYEDTGSDPPAGRWVDDKDPSRELFTQIASIVRESAGVTVIPPR